MDNNIDTIKSQFRLSAYRLFSFIFDDFKKNVKTLDRQKDENVFRQLQGRYSLELEKQLGQLAGKFIDSYKGKKDVNALQYDLTNQIAYIISEFDVKIRSM